MTAINAIILLACRNNGKTIADMVRSLRDLGLLVVVADDCSIDNSAEIARQAGAVVVRLPKSRGKGAALRSAFTYIQVNHPDIDFIVTADAGAGHDPADIRRLLGSAGPRTLAVGSRRIGTHISFGNLIAIRFVWRLLESIGVSDLRDPFSDAMVLPAQFVFSRKWRRKDVGISAEFVVAALRNGFTVASVATGTPYTPPTVGALREVAGYAAFQYVRSGRIGRVIPAALLILFGFALFFQFDTAFNNTTPPLFRPGISGTLVEERRLALEWLKRHSPEDAVVIADQFDGNYIVALADRRAVSSSKVYPSEAKEVAKRYRDISRFFFALNEGSALDIARQYGVDYVLLTNEFPYRRNCELVNACHFVSGADLTPMGKKLTMLGKFQGREPLENFELVWDSPNFSIYRVLNGETERNPCRLTVEEKRIALRIARYAFVSGDKGLPKDTRLPQVCSAAVTFYRNGKKFGPEIAEDMPLGHAIFLASRAVRPDDGNVVGTIQVAIFSTEELVPRSRQTALPRRLNPEKVYVLENKEGRAVAFPEKLNGEVFEGTDAFFESICKDAGMPENCAYFSKIKVAPVQIFAEGTSGDLLEVAATLPLLAEVSEFSDSVLRKRVTLARDWLWSVRTRTGDFRNEINPHAPAVSTEEHRLASLYGAAETWWLIESLPVMPHPGVIPFARSQSDRHERIIRSGEDERTAFLIYAGLENLSLWRATDETLYRDRAIAYGDILVALFADNTNLAQSFRMINGRPEISDRSPAGTIANNSGLYFLAQVAALKKNDKTFRETVLLFARELKDKFRHNRIIDPDVSPVWESWLVNAFARVADLTGDRGDADFALEVADWVLQFQSRDEYLHKRGAFRDKAATSGVGKITEALMEAVSVAEKWEYDITPFLDGLREAMRWLMSVQYTEESSYFLSQNARREMAGALRARLDDITAEVDSAGHFVLAGGWYLKWLYAK